MQYYDLRKKCEGSLCYDFSNMEQFLNKKIVREALGVGEIDFCFLQPHCLSGYADGLDEEP